MRLEKLRTREGLLSEIQRLVAEVKERAPGADAAAVMLKGKVMACNDAMRKSNLRLDVADAILATMIEASGDRIIKDPGADPKEVAICRDYSQQIRMAYNAYFDSLGTVPGSQPGV